MTLPAQFNEKNHENILIYHYVEELVSNYGKYINDKMKDEEITRAELPFLLRIRYKDNTTQKELVELFNVSEGYTAKILRKFEDKGYIKRYENPENHRIKIVKITSKGIEKTDDYINDIKEWENNVTRDLTEKELKQLKNLLFKLL
ncbi:MAG TPA: winged helix-turn-helix transcriptional regulator [Methanosphaera sp.]|nr:winged helix-turn-helix transcriptional regulator [Methanosphaera sp.]